MHLLIMMKATLHQAPLKIRGCGVLSRSYHERLFFEVLLALLKKLNLFKISLRLPTSKTKCSHAEASKKDLS
jgi:hypothetical protein